MWYPEFSSGESRREKKMANFGSLRVSLYDTEYGDNTEVGNLYPTPVIEAYASNDRAAIRKLNQKLVEHGLEPYSEEEYTDEPASASGRWCTRAQYVLGREDQELQRKLGYWS